MDMNSSELRRILNKLGMKQEDFAKEAGVSQPSISRWINGRVQMHPIIEKHIRQVAEELLSKAS